MCFGSTPKFGAQPAQPQAQDAIAAGNDALRKRAGMQGYAQTILGGAVGPQANTAPGKSLMGGAVKQMGA